MSYYGRSDTTQRVVLVGLVALVLGLVLGAGAGFGGGVLTQRQAPSHSGGGSAAPAAPPAAATSIPGASRVVNGIGAGFSHDENGAVQAARQVASLVISPDALDDGRWATVRRQLVAEGAPFNSEPTIRPVTEMLFDWPGGRVPEGGVLTDTPVAWKTVSYTATTAQVGIWAVVVGGSPSTSKFRELWVGATYELRWERGDWRLWDSVGWGPEHEAVPLPIQPATPEQGLPVQLRGFHAF